jgi:hypothetical protein
LVSSKFIVEKPTKEKILIGNTLIEFEEEDLQQDDEDEPVHVLEENFDMIRTFDIYFIHNNLQAILNRRAVPQKDREHHATVIGVGAQYSNNMAVSRNVSSNKTVSVAGAAKGMNFLKRKFGKASPTDKGGQLRDSEAKLMKSEKQFPIPAQDTGARNSSRDGNPSMIKSFSNTSYMVPDLSQFLKEEPRRNPKRKVTELLSERVFAIKMEDFGFARDVRELGHREYSVKPEFNKNEKDDIVRPVTKVKKKKEVPKASPSDTSFQKFEKGRGEGSPLKKSNTYVINFNNPDEEGSEKPPPERGRANPENQGRAAKHEFGRKTSRV